MRKRVILGSVTLAVLVVLIPVSIWLVLHFAIHAYLEAPSTSPPANASRFEDLKIREPFESPDEPKISKDDLSFDPDLASDTRDGKK